LSLGGPDRYWAGLLGRAEPAAWVARQDAARAAAIWDRPDRAVTGCMKGRLLTRMGGQAATSWAVRTFFGKLSFSTRFLKF